MPPEQLIYTIVQLAAKQAEAEARAEPIEVARSRLARPGILLSAVRCALCVEAIETAAPVATINDRNNGASIATTTTTTTTTTSTTTSVYSLVV